MTTSAAASAEIAKVAQTAVTTEELLSGDSNILDQLLLMFEKGLNVSCSLAGCLRNRSSS